MEALIEQPQDDTVTSIAGLSTWRYKKNKNNEKSRKQ